MSTVQPVSAPACRLLYKINSRSLSLAEASPPLSQRPYLFLGGASRYFFCKYVMKTAFRGPLITIRVLTGTLVAGDVSTVECYSTSPSSSKFWRESEISLGGALTPITWDAHNLQSPAANSEQSRSGLDNKFIVCGTFISVLHIFYCMLYQSFKSIFTIMFPLFLLKLHQCTALHWEKNRPLNKTNMSKIYSC